ncbi:185_t:CDS:2 [Paraglomus occultum]|uniref:185_t:CDS:1 n=1 Tax=Paraglomus occultum TaxID=144539 RepID=A0A9N9GGU3_9GLOM|nr:185_t:CDS:2 [Paraglomus occultum]
MYAVAFFYVCIEYIGKLTIEDWNRRQHSEKFESDIVNKVKALKLVEDWERISNELNQMRDHEDVEQFCTRKVASLWSKVEPKLLNTVKTKAKLIFAFDESWSLLQRPSSRETAQIFPQTFNNLPNLHVSQHLVMHAQNYGTLVNTAVAVKEMVHQIFKGMGPIIIVSNKNSGTGEDLDNAVNNKGELFSGNQHFTEISVRKCWPRAHVEQMNLPTKLVYVGNWLEYDLAYAYDYYLDLKAALLKKKLKYYDSISYSVMDDDENVKWIHVSIGDI